jgi:sugar lactone lactonase YvrE
MIRSLLRRNPSARNLAAALALTSGLLLVSAPSASALSKHVFSTSFAGSGTNALSNPSDVEVDQSTGDVYVTDPANHRVEKFSSAGSFILMFGKGVDSTTGGGVCTAASGDVCQAGAKGATAGSFTAPAYLAIDSSNGDVYVGDLVMGQGSGNVQKFDSSGDLVTSWAKGGLLDGSEDPDGRSFAGSGEAGGLTGVAVVPAGNLFVYSASGYFEFAADGSFIRDFRSLEEAPDLSAPSADRLYAEHLTGPITEIDPETLDLFSISGNSVEHFPTSCDFSNAPPCALADSFGDADLSDPRGVAIDDFTNTVYVADAGAQRVAAFSPVPYLANATASATPLTPTTERLAGSVDPAGAGSLSACHFDYGTDTTYALGSVECDPSTPIGAKADVTAASDLSGLLAGSDYHYRLEVEDANGASASYDQIFTTLPLAPVIGATSVSAVHADAATVHVQINPGGGEATYHTTYRVQYVTEAQFQAGGFAGASQTAAADAGSAKSSQALSTQLSGLSPNTTYHYRVVAENASGSTEGAAHTFNTLPFFPTVEDPCSNAHVRQQTGAALLLDCRAYELASAANTAGYDVESSLIAGQAPYTGYPEAEGRLLYGVHNGGIPGTGSPTNRGVDPYVATRSENGWSTKYIGIPAAGTPSKAPFSSTVSGADAKLETFAFGGPEICSPCFQDESTGIPVHEPNGDLIQGMAGSEDPGPTAKASEVVAKPLSANGEHLVFASTSRFEPDGNEGEVSIYDRDLETGTTHVVSKTPAAATMTGPGIAELDVSKDGSHVLIGQLVSEAQGDKHWHLFMNVGDSIRTIDLTPGATTGVLYAGMSSDGSKVFFTTKDKLTSEDEDESTDLYTAEFGEDSYGRRLVSTGTGGTGNTDSCDPVANSAHVHWNTKGSEANCGVVAIGGGGGVASGDGTAYFLSPERLDGSSNGTENAPNLYVVRPDSAPHYVTTLESVLSGPQPPREGRLFVHNFGSFTSSAGLAVDHSSGDVYTMDAATNTVEKFDSSGNLVTSFGDSTPGPDGRLRGSATPAGAFEELAPYPGQLAVDQSNGDLYVPDIFHGVVDKFTSSGEYLSQVSVEFASAVAIDPANGDIYATSAFGSVNVFDASGTPVSSFPATGFLAGLAVTATGKAYVSNGEETNIYKPNGELEGQLDPRSSRGLSVDPSNGDVYVNEGNQIARFDSAGKELETFGAGRLSESDGLAMDLGGNLYASNGSKVTAFSPMELLAGPAIDSPLVIDSVDRPASRRSADFQLTANGQYAAFGSALALGGGEEETDEHAEVYRYDAAAKALDCASCQSTGAPSEGDSSMVENGLSLSEDGRVFFNASAQLTSADTDGKQDVYEWAKPGAGNCGSESPTFSSASGTCLALISAGTSPFDSGLLTATSNGKDALFFTRDSLAPQDKNGATMKIYDAREGGGFPYVNPPVQCQASDECHGAASAAPAPLGAGSIAGSPGNVLTEKKAHHKKKNRHKKHHRHQAKANNKRGGAK